MKIPLWYHEAVTASVAIGQRMVFFIVGCQKSGTTWVQTLLDAHPGICCQGEGHFGDIVGPMLEQAVGLYNEHERTTWSLDQQEVFSVVRLMSDQVLGKYLATSPDPDAIKVIGDKTPESAVAMASLSTLYPGSRFVHIIRDGRDATVSGWAHLGRLDKQSEFDSFADYAEYFARHHWVPYITRAREAAAEMPDRYLEIRYEDLHTDPLIQTGILLTFLGVEATDELTSSCVDAASFDNLTGGRRPGDEDPSSHFRKGIIGDWHNHFDEPTLARFEDEAGDLLRELGYAETSAATSRT